MSKLALVVRQRFFSGADRATVSGFTLVETLVVILVIGILLALIIPSLAASRTAARVTKSLSTQRQIVSAITSYAAAGKDRLPNFGSAGGLAGTISVGGSAFRNGYFRTHMTAWPYLVCPTDAAMLGALRNPTDERVLEDTNPTHHTTLFYMTATAFADPLLFDGSHAKAADVVAENLRSVHLAEFVSPAKKGLVIDMYMRELFLGKRANNVTLAATGMDITGFADGSAEKLAASDGLPTPVGLEYVGVAATRVLTTRGGAAGRDR